MAFNDSLSDMLARIKNAHRARKSITSCYKSNLNMNVLSVLKDEGYIRDFRGLNPNSFDGSGNYSMGIKEQIIFPEINYDKIDKVRGLNITICTSAKNNSDALELLKCFNMPFLGREES